MDKFWKWMEKNDHGDNRSTRVELYGYGFDPPKRMLVGYMIEYLSEHNRILNKLLAESIDNYGSRLQQLIEEIK